ncbi:MAG: AAA family ATPase [Chlorobi bacterium]|nr:AAA family ATPase [Chlorobiota bacterium]
MQTLVDFLNHGTLPMIGRQALIARILQTVQSAAESEGLHTLLLIGEAGIGKSRAVEGACQQIEETGGLVIATRIVPEATLTLAPALARALEQSETAQELLRHDVPANLNDVVAGLRRLSRLRPTLVVVEDTHLLEGDGIRQLGLLLEGLSDETLTLLCSARPSANVVGTLLEQYPFQQMELAGLLPSEIEELWGRLFGVIPDPAITAMLARLTTGNPLALRSALRGAVTAGIIVQTAGSGRYVVDSDSETFIAHIERSSKRIGEGMAAHLMPDERAAAERLAWLGEAFARETAAHALQEMPQAELLLERLLFRGILQPHPMPATPLPGIHSEGNDFPASALPLLSFTHTLLHRYFLDHAPPHLGRLCAIVAADLPLYSYLPVDIIGERVGQISEPEQTLLHLLGRIRKMAAGALETSDLAAMRRMANHAQKMFQRFGEGSHSEAWQAEQVHLLVMEYVMARADTDAERCIAICAQLEALTAAPTTEHHAGLRIVALVRLMAQYPRQRPHYAAQALELAERFPQIRASRFFLLLLANVALRASNEGRNDEVRLIEQEFQRARQLPMGKKQIEMLWGYIGPPLLRVFDTPDELQERRMLLADLQGRHGWNILQRESLAKHSIAFHDAIGEPDAALRVLESWQEVIREHDGVSAYYGSQIVRIHLLAALGAPLLQLQEAANAMLQECPAEHQNILRHFIGSSFATVGLLRGEREWGMEMLAQFPEGKGILLPSTALGVMLCSGVAELPEASERSDPPQVADDLGLLLRLLAEAASGDSILPVAERLLARPLLRIDDLTRFHTIIHLIEWKPEPALWQGLQLTLRRAITQGLTWLQTQRIAAYMPPLIALAEKFLPAKEVKAWRGSCAAIQRERDAQLRAMKGTGQISITMIGAITVQLPGQEPRKISGARARTVLGLMVAAQLADRPFSHRDFCAIATGDQDPDRARNVVYVRLHDLRELLGPDAIITEPELAPRLDPATVRVDILEAYQHLLQAKKALRGGALLRVVPALLQAQQLLRGEVPFPGLYEEIFEAAREEIETMLRGLAIRTARALLREGDTQNAIRLLNNLLQAMPEDEEASGLLQQGLAEQGKRTEAERVRTVTAE